VENHLLFAQANPFDFGMILPLVAIFAIFYFMIIRPQQKKAKDHQKLIEALEKGDKVLLNSGMHGTIAGIEDKTVLVDVGNNIKIKFERASIAAVLKDKS